MQNDNNRSKKMSWDKGYYIALILCIAAVGISGYLFTTTVSNDTTEAAAPRAATAPAAAPPTKPAAAAESPDDALSAAVIAPETEAPTEPAEEAQETLLTVSPVSGELLQGYSMDHLSFNSTTRDWRTHDGVDLSCALGTPVLAAADGVVERVYEDDFLGTTVIVSHRDGYVSCYSNLDEQVNVSEGQQVKAGDLLGAVGASALLEIGAKPHLHFSVTRNSVSVDPLSFVSNAA